MATASKQDLMRVPMQSVVVMREKKMMSPPLGQAFEFTADEIAQIDKMNPDALTKMVSVDVTKVSTGTGDDGTI